MKLNHLQNGVLKRLNSLNNKNLAIERKVKKLILTKIKEIELP